MTDRSYQPTPEKRPDRVRTAGLIILALGVAIFLLDLFLNIEHLHPIWPPILAVVLMLVGLVTVVISFVKAPKRHE